MKVNTFFHTNSFFFDLNKRHIFSHSSEAWKSKIKMLATLSETFLLGSPGRLLPVFTWSFLCVHLLLVFHTKSLKANVYTYYTSQLLLNFHWKYLIYIEIA